MRKRNTTRQAGFTLVELIVAIGIIAALATLTALYFPRYQDKEMVARGADNLQGWLLNAKQRAKRDGLPTGLLLVVQTDPKLNLTSAPLPLASFPNNPLIPAPFVNEIHYIQQPDDFAQGLYVGPQVVGATTNFKMATFSGVDLHNLGGIKIKTGDYLEIFGSGTLRRIGNPNRLPPIPVDYPVLDPAAPGPVGTLLELDPVAADLPSLPAPPVVLNPEDTNKPNQRTNYRIIAQPRELAGEQKLFMPENIGIDLNWNNPLNLLPDSNPDPSWIATAPVPSYQTSRNLPRRNGNIEIMFSPSGAVIGQGTSSGKIILWVRDLTRRNSDPNAPDLLLGSGTLITIDTRTGFIAAHAAVKSTMPQKDPYIFTRDGRSSGL